MHILLAGKHGRMNKILYDQALSKGWEVSCGDRYYSVNQYVALIKEREIDCIIDFSNQIFWPKLKEILHTVKVPLISGTTGIIRLANDLEILSKTIPLCHSTNFSVGMQLMYKFLRVSAKTEYNTLLIEEDHHALKKDSPSGTALDLASYFNVDPNLIRVKREGNVPGTHRVTLFFDGEELVLEHKVFDRTIYAKGALAMVPWLKKQVPGCYDFNQFFDRGI